MARREELEAQGWVEKTVQDEPQLSELKNIYEEVGYEVLLEPFEPTCGETCTTCLIGDPNRYMIVYTKKSD